MGPVLFYVKGHEDFWTMVVFKWEIYEWEMDEMDSGVGRGDGLHIRVDGGILEKNREMHEEDSD